MASETSDDGRTRPARAPGQTPSRKSRSDDLVTTHHEITVDGTALPYTVQAGRVVLRKEQIGDDEFAGAKATAEVFVVAYTADDAGDPARRPVTFAFNGGPGSSSVWLHLGLLGPRRVLMGDAGALLPPPYGLADNEQTLLRHSDLVFIDPVSTGFSARGQGRQVQATSTASAGTSSRSARSSGCGPPARTAGCRPSTCAASPTAPPGRRPWPAICRNATGCT